MPRNSIVTDPEPYGPENPYKKSIFGSPTGLDLPPDGDMANYISDHPESVKRGEMPLSAGGLPGLLRGVDMAALRSPQLLEEIGETAAPMIESGHGAAMRALRALQGVGKTAKQGAGYVGSGKKVLDSGVQAKEGLQRASDEISQRVGRYATSGGQGPAIDPAIADENNWQQVKKYLSNQSWLRDR